MCIKMKIISVLDTSICDYNIGNQIIMEAIYHAIDDIFGGDFFFRIQYREKFGKLSLQYLKKSNYVFFGGTNSLSSNMNSYSQMGFRLADLLYFRHLTLLGLGWWKYQPNPNPYTRFFLRSILSRENLHSVRDSYTLGMLSNIGICNVVNTCCPTTWGLTDEHCRKIPTKKRESVIATLTDYNTSLDNDEKLLNLLCESYKTVYVWVQGVGDIKHIERLKLAHKSKIIIVPPSLKKFDQILNDYDLDYIGTRLHAGIRALQRTKRSLILSVDNRAKEISRDIGLNVCERSNFFEIQDFIENDYVTRLSVPFGEIAKWKAQFC